MREKIHTPEESIQIIDKMMELTRTSVREGSWYYYLFGILVIIASLGHFILLKLGYPNADLIWSIFIIGGIAAAVKSIKDKRHHKAQSSIFGFIWLAAGFTYVTLLVGVNALNDSAFMLVNPIVFSLAGGATFLSGKMMQFRPFVLGGLAMWAIAILQLFVGLETQLLLNILAVTVGYLLPAYLLKKS